MAGTQYRPDAEVRATQSFKVSFAGSIRRFSFSPKGDPFACFDELRSLICDMFPSVQYPFHFRYEDHEGDMITVTTDREAAELFKMYGPIPLELSSEGAPRPTKILLAGEVPSYGEESPVRDVAIVNPNCEERFACNPKDFMTYDTDRMRSEFLVGHDQIFQDGKVGWVYSHCDRLMLGGAVPTSGGGPLSLDPVDPQKSDYFLERREMCAFNVSGGLATITVGVQTYTLDHMDMLYIGLGNQTVSFSAGASATPHLYLVSTLAYATFPTTLVPAKNAIPKVIGTDTGASVRTLKQYTIGVLTTSQISCGITTVSANSVWNTCPCHTHARRTEAYMYFDLPLAHDGAVPPFNNRICHLMGPPTETRCLWVSNEEAVIATPGFVHFAAGTQNYSFVWVMAGENPLAFDDQDVVDPTALK